LLKYTLKNLPLQFSGFFHSCKLISSCVILEAD
jgi:hypothetical protein